MPDMRFGVDPSCSLPSRCACSLGCRRSAARLGGIDVGRRGRASSLGRAARLGGIDVGRRSRPSFLSRAAHSSGIEGGPQLRSCHYRCH